MEVIGARRAVVVAALGVEAAGVGENSGPLSDLMCFGMPCLSISPASIRRTSRELCFRATSIARHWRVNSSTTVRNFRGLPSRVRSNTKSYAHTWLPYAGLSLIQDPSLSHSRPRLGCLAGTFSPSRRQIRSTRL